MNTLRTRIFGAVASLGFAAMAVVAPVAAQANQTIYQDAAQLKAQITNSEYTAAIAGACFANAVSYELQNDCLNILDTQNVAMGNARNLVYTLTGTWPNNPALSTAQKNEINYLINRNNFYYAGHFNESIFVHALDRAFEDGVAGANGAFPYAITGAAICSAIGFTSGARSYCSSLMNTDAYEYNIFQNFATMSEGNI